MDLTTDPLIDPVRDPELAEPATDRQIIIRTGRHWGLHVLVAMIAYAGGVITGIWSSVPLTKAACGHS